MITGYELRVTLAERSRRARHFFANRRYYAKTQRPIILSL
jgi:hypothetical protein